MSSKKWRFNEETKLFEVINEISEKREGRLKEWLSLIISIVAVLVSIIAIVISNQQKGIDKMQADIASMQLILETRQFNAEKSPQFTLYVESQDIYSEDEYRVKYIHWLNENDIHDFFDWQYFNWVNGKLEYEYNPYEYFSQETIELWPISEKTMWKFNRYAQNDRISKYNSGELTLEELEIGSSDFWNPYIDYDYGKLSEITNGEFDILKNVYEEYEEYLSATEYLSYPIWKADNKHETQRIVLENTGAHISEAELKIYIFMNNSIILEEFNIHYRFGIDMNGLYLLSGYAGNFNKSTYDYDMQNNTFSLEFEQRPSLEYEQNQYQEIHNVWNRALDRLDDFKDSDIIAHFVLSNTIYFSLSYLDLEKNPQQDWYKYDPDSHKLSNANVYDIDLDEPLITQYKSFFDYFDSYSGYVAKRLGYSNSHYRNWLDDGNKYIYQAEEKLLADLAKLLK